MTPDEIRREIRAKIVDLASEIGRKADNLGDDVMIPQTGYLDSPGIMGLIAWYETRFGLDIDQQELTLDNFGSVNAMVEYACRKQ